MTEIELYTAIAAFIRSGHDHDPQIREQLASKVLARQFKLFPAWGRLQRRQSIPQVDPGLTAVRPYPVQLYKEATNVSAAQGHVYETSGTSSQQPGRVWYSARDMELMQLAIDRNAATHLFADACRESHMLVLAPSPTERPAMIMAAGMQRLGQQFCQRVEFYVRGGALDLPALLGDLRAACTHATPLTLAGGSFAFVGLADHLIASDQTLKLPRGSRILDAGGTKGRSRAVSRPEFRALMAQAFGVAESWQANLLGMTELGSQFYDHVVGQARPVGDDSKRNPPWTQTWAVHPASLEALPVGETGLLVHLDLANFDHPAFVLTEDLGRTTPTGFEIDGRAQGAELRGCALIMEEFKQGESEL